MKRRLLNLATGLSLLLSLLAAAMWVRSYYSYDRVERVTYSFDDDKSQTLAAWSAVGRFAFLVDRRVHPASAWIGLRRYTWPDPEKWKSAYLSPAMKRDLGFAGLEVNTFRSDGNVQIPGQRTRQWLVLVPHWMATLVFGVMPGWRLTRRLLVGKTYPPGHCRRCGYDMRATPERCPECGAEPAEA